MWCWIMHYESNQMQMLGVVSESLPGAVEGALNKGPQSTLHRLSWTVIFRNTALKPGFLVPNLDISVARVIFIKYLIEPEYQLRF